MRILCLGIILSVLVFMPLKAQQGRKETIAGNELYEKERFQEAREKYEEGLQAAPESPVLRFNLGDTQYKLDLLEEAIGSYQEALESEDRMLRAQAYYNLGNTLFKQGKFQDSLEAYKESLRLNNSDLDAKHNLEMALRQLEQSPPEQQKNQEDSENQDEQQQEQQSDEEQEQDSEANQSDPENQPGQDSESQQDQQNPDQERQSESEAEQNSVQEEAPQGNEQEDMSSPSGEPDVEKMPMSKEQAEQLLAALRENPEDLLKKKVKPGEKVSGGRDW